MVMTVVVPFGRVMAMLVSVLLFSASGVSYCQGLALERPVRRPNILFAIADDQSFPHASAYGSRMFRTPAFDRVAAAGVLFRNAFVAAPQCSPSRAAILTGRNIWQLAEAGTHSSHFPSRFAVFPDRLAAAGYAIGFTGKGWGPGNWRDSGWSRNPAGPEYNEVPLSARPASGVHATDYAANFRAFLSRREAGQPFFFWYGGEEPHRVYEPGSGVRAGIRTDSTEIPGFLPDHRVVREDLADYAFEIGWFDRQLGEMIRLLQEAGEWEHTIVIVTADNGMAYPYAKANLQAFGTHVPLAVCGPGVRPRPGGTDALVSLADIAPTVLEMAGLPQLPGASAVSWQPLLAGAVPDGLTAVHPFLVTGRERHTHARPDNLGYPARSIFDGRYLYIRNLKPDRWPAGDPPPAAPVAGPLPKGMKPIVEGYEDVDESPVKTLLLNERDRYPELFRLAFARRPAEQLYDLVADPYCLRDLAAMPRQRAVRHRLSARLDSTLRAQGDPRLTGGGDVFDTYPRFGNMRPFPGFRSQGVYNR
jgi:uncharacterized sulfatase